MARYRASLIYNQFRQIVSMNGLTVGVRRYKGKWTICGGRREVRFKPINELRGLATIEGVPEPFECDVHEAIRIAKVDDLGALGASLRAKASSIGRKSAQKLRKELLDTDPHCYWCGRPLNVPSSTLDHRVPLAKGGTNRRENLVLCCDPCNQAKAAMLPEEFGARTWCRLM
jgi:5-methylcytosine-specific restriction endonuclease McrA